jgi:hypothetical protein
MRTKGRKGFGGEEEPGDGTPSDSVLEILGRGHAEMTELGGLDRIGRGTILTLAEASGWRQLDHRQPLVTRR